MPLWSWTSFSDITPTIERRRGESPCFALGGLGVVSSWVSFQYQAGFKD